jgi:hypothetical protein
MVLMESFFKWALIGIVGAMVVVGMAGGALSAIGGMMGNPAVILVVVVVFSGFALFLVVPGIVGGLWLLRWWRMAAITERRASEFVAPDEAGRLPVPASLLRQPEFAHRAIDSHQASYLANLSTFHYSPESNQNITGADGQTMTAAATTTPSTFWQLYQAGQLPGKGFLMGYSLDEDGQEVTADWRELYSSLVGGKSGAGKSTLIRSILAQSALQGGRFVVVDPHYASGEESLGASLAPLRSLMLCDVASEEKQIVDALRYIGQIGQRRLAGQDKERWPLILVVDETTALFQRSNVAGVLCDVLGQISQETRKVGVYAMCIGQNFDGRVMDTTVRNSFVSMISMRARRDVARVQSGNTEFGRMAETLTIGQCVWMAPSGEMHRLAVPNCTAGDLELVARSFEGKNVYVADNAQLPVVEAPSFAPSFAPSTAIETGQQDGIRSGSKTASEVASEVADMARAERVISLFIAGESITKIVKDVYGVAGGDKYTRAANEVNEILRSHMLSLKGRVN